jgi:hypothetical protein
VIAPANQEERQTFEDVVSLLAVVVLANQVFCCTGSAKSGIAAKDNVNLPIQIGSRNVHEATLTPLQYC